MNDSVPPQLPTQTGLTEARIMECLRQVLDPEIGCNIVDLGLVYGVQIHGSIVIVQMTLTTPGCPMHESIAAGATAALLGMEEVDDAEVQIVWDPPWNPSMMTEYGREHIGMMG
jgi:metal-sulfur cluster biosynthetic enzyme